MGSEGLSECRWERWTVRRDAYGGVCGLTALWLMEVERQMLNACRNGSRNLVRGRAWVKGDWYDKYGFQWRLVRHKRVGEDD